MSLKDTIIRMRGERHSVLEISLLCGCDVRKVRGIVRKHEREREKKRKRLWAVEKRKRKKEEERVRKEDEERVEAKERKRRNNTPFGKRFLGKTGR